MKKDAKTKKQESAVSAATTSEIAIKRFERGRIQVALLGLTPFVCNRQSEKTKRELVLPAIKQKAGARTTLKHEPYEEFQASPYKDDNPDGPTLIQMKGGAFKSAACDSAVDTSDVKAAQVRRLVSVPEFYVSIYGIPQLWMTDVRQAGISRTPDIRTRAIIPQWCAIVTYTFVMPMVNEAKLLHLIENGGMTRGVGDGRTEKGALDFGQYTVVNRDDAQVKAIMLSGGRLAQIEAMENPRFYDAETADLYSWFYEELDRRKKVGNAGSRNGVEELTEDLAEEIYN